MATYHRLSTSPRPSTSSLQALELSPPSSPPLRRGRHDTLSSISGFDFALDSLVIPLSRSGEEDHADGGEVEKHVGLVNGQSRRRSRGGEGRRELTIFPLVVFLARPRYRPCRRSSSWKRDILFTRCGVSERG